MPDKGIPNQIEFPRVRKPRPTCEGWISACIFCGEEHAYWQCPRMKESAVQTEEKRATKEGSAVGSIAEALGNRGLDDKERTRMRELQDKSGRTHKKLTKAEQQELSALESVDKAEHKRQALIHKLISGADTYGRKRMSSITRTITDRVKALKEEEQALVADLTSAHRKSKADAERTTKKSMQSIQEAHNRAIKGLVETYEGEVSAARKRFGKTYNNASDELSEEIDSVANHVAEFAQEVKELELEQLEKLQKEGVLQMDREGGSTAYLTVPGHQED